MTLAAHWFEQHRERLNTAVSFLHSREAWTPFVESPSRRHHPDGAHDAGRRAYEARLGETFALDLPGQMGWLGAERSPYTGELLEVRYPRVAAEPLAEAMLKAWPAWRQASVAERVGVCMEMLDRWAQQSFEHTYATMHTTGQPFMLAFAGSGASSLDRGLEALAMAWDVMQALPRRATYARHFGRGAPVRLEKRYRPMPVGIAVVLSCGSYPAWNAYPAMMANLATGNPVVVKPHPETILPMAIAVETARTCLQEAGFDPNLLTLACDTWEEPIATALFDHPATAIIDFTGGQQFGTWIEERYSARRQVYTETAGCNAVVLDSAADLDAALGAIAHGMAFFSAQMCTAPQNIWVPRTGVRDGDTLIDANTVVDRLREQIDALVEQPHMAAAVCGALHASRTLDACTALQTQSADRVVRPSAPYAHPDYPNARTATPLLIRLDAQERALAQREHFGPMAFVIQADDRDQALAGATQDARRCGAIASYAYTTDPSFIGEVEDAFALAGASVGINLVRQRPINFTAAFSDYHVTGLNPAGNACLTDPAFVQRRFRMVQSKVELPE
ncbi:MAG: aldehyde dehydrogenase family protein [Myxococcota bacterium]